MHNVKLDHWFIKENTFEISLQNFFVSIQVRKRIKYIYIVLRVVDLEQHEATFIFKTLEDALKFTEEIINKSSCTEDIINFYNLSKYINVYNGPKLVRSKNGI